MTLWPPVLLLLGTLAVVLLLVLLPDRDRGLASGRMARIGRMGRLSARLWTSYLGARVRRFIAGPEAHRRIDAARRQADGERIAAEMGQMKGALMKLGQMMSFVSEDVPAEYRLALASLQASAPPMDFALIRDVLERELERPLERAFARFEPEPIAAASIGQVHRAELESGELAVVKVQYPGVAAAIAADLDNAALLYRMMGMLYPALDPKPVVDELRARIGEELDYRYEARNQSAFHQAYADHPFVRIPRVHERHSTSLVLASELMQGRRFAEVLDASDEERSRWGEILYRFVFGSIFRLGALNGDPHPGNYLFGDDGRMIFIDFGCVKYFPEQMLARWKRLVRAHLEGDAAEFRRLAVEAGFLTEAAEIDADRLYRYFGYFYEPFQDDRRFRFGREYTQKSFRLVFAPDGEFEGFHKQLNMPRDFVFVNRLQWGVYSVLADLRAEANWHRIHRELLYGDPPSTQLGELDAEFFAGLRARRGLGESELLLTPEGISARNERAA